ncbi:MAG: hypothetical protein AB8E15_11435 [Bdellovibrionales bacterium]
MTRTKEIISSILIISISILPTRAISKDSSNSLKVHSNQIFKSFRESLDRIYSREKDQKNIDFEMKKLHHFAKNNRIQYVTSLDGKIKMLVNGRTEATFVKDKTEQKKWSINGKTTQLSFVDFTRDLKLIDGTFKTTQHRKSNILFQEAHAGFGVFLAIAGIGTLGYLAYDWYKGLDDKKMLNVVEGAIKETPKVFSGQCSSVQDKIVAKKQFTNIISSIPESNKQNKKESLDEVRSCLLTAKSQKRIDKCDLFLKKIKFQDYRDPVKDRLRDFYYANKKLFFCINQVKGRLNLGEDSVPDRDKGGIQ